MLVWYANWQVLKSSDGLIYNSTDQVPYKKVGLLLGTSKYLGNGKRNPFFKYRVESAFALFKMRKIKYIIISGDHSEKYYNEPLDMKNELLALGVPDSILFLDFAGLRTYDSMVRCHKIFGQNDFMVISQEFHNERALYIANQLNIKAIAYNAKEPTMKVGIKTYFREYFARVKVLLDVLLKNDPKHMGDKINIPA